MGGIDPLGGMGEIDTLGGMGEIDTLWGMVKWGKRYYEMNRMTTITIVDDIFFLFNSYLHYV
jgi:hypothetical protein